MSWRLANSLITLRDQINALYPGRNKGSDGTIGDAAHQAEVSDHNPDARGIVRALDITHDPSAGCDIGTLSDALCSGRDSRLSYMIANHLITGPNYGWTWVAYDGDDPHTNHIHISVIAGGGADNAAYWSFPGLRATEEKDMTPEEHRLLANTERILTCLCEGKKPFGVDYGGGQALKTLPNPFTELSEHVSALTGTAVAPTKEAIVAALREVLGGLDS